MRRKHPDQAFRGFISARRRFREPSANYDVDTNRLQTSVGTVSGTTLCYRVSVSLRIAGHESECVLRVRPISDSSFPPSPTVVISSAAERIPIAVESSSPTTSSYQIFRKHDRSFYCPIR